VGARWRGVFVALIAMLRDMTDEAADNQTSDADHRETLQKGRN